MNLEHMVLGARRNMHILTFSMLHFIWTRKHTTYYISHQITVLNRCHEAGRICHNYRVNDPFMSTCIISFRHNNDFHYIEAVQI
jgi:hypothetical protein